MGGPLTKLGPLPELGPCPDAGSPELRSPVNLILGDFFGDFFVGRAFNFLDETPTIGNFDLCAGGKRRCGPRGGKPPVVRSEIFANQTLVVSSRAGRGCSDANSSSSIGEITMSVSGTKGSSSRSSFSKSRSSASLSSSA